MKYATVREAAEHWVRELIQIPTPILEKLMFRGDEVEEITPPAKGDRVFFVDGEFYGKSGVIVCTKYDGEDDLYGISPDGYDEDYFLIVSRDEFEVDQDELLPMWGTMWAFDDFCDNDWLEEHLQEMADCGFRIYEQEDYKYIFGIDGAGYDFYENHWIPLYKARGLQWHEENRSSQSSQK